MGPRPGTTVKVRSAELPHPSPCDGFFLEGWVCQGGAFKHAAGGRCSQLTAVHCSADGRPSFYTHENAPGVVMAVGNTGEYLEQAADAMCTWLSRDGGATWQDVMPYAGIYECASAHLLPRHSMDAAQHVDAGVVPCLLARLGTSLTCL